MAGRGSGWLGTALGLPHNPAEAAEVARNKFLSRQRLQAAGLPVPPFTRFGIDQDPRDVVSFGQRPPSSHPSRPLPSHLPRVHYETMAYRFLQAGTAPLLAKGACQASVWT